MFLAPRICRRGLKWGAKSSGKSHLPISSPLLYPSPPILISSPRCSCSLCQSMGIPCLLSCMMSFWPWVIGVSWSRDVKATHLGLITHWSLTLIMVSSFLGHFLDSLLHFLQSCRHRYLTIWGPVLCRNHQHGKRSVFWCCKGLLTSFHAAQFKLEIPWNSQRGRTGLRCVYWLLIMLSLLTSSRHLPIGFAMAKTMTMTLACCPTHPAARPLLQSINALLTRF